MVYFEGLCEWGFLDDIPTLTTYNVPHTTNNTQHAEYIYAYYAGVPINMVAGAGPLVPVREDVGGRQSVVWVCLYFFGVRRESASLVTPTMLSADFPSCGFIHKKSDGLAPRPPLSRSKCVKNSPALNSLTQLWESIGGLPFGAADLRQGVPVQILLNVQPHSRGGVEQIIPSPFAHTLPPIHRHQGVLRAGTCHILLILPSFFSGCIHTEGGVCCDVCHKKGACACAWGGGCKYLDDYFCFPPQA